MDKIFTQKKTSTNVNTSKNGNQKTISHQPENDIVFAILNYSKSLVVKKSATSEQFEVVLN